MFLDIRNFSSHRQLLAQTNSARPLTDLIKGLLEGAVIISKTKLKQLGITKNPLLNHTGDGFVLVFQGGGVCLAALKFASHLRILVEELIAKYQRAFESWCKRNAAKARSLPSLHYGIGIHCGSVTSFKYKSFTMDRRAFLGSAVNIASRVEACTKDHPYPVLCTEKVVQQARVELGKPANLGFEDYFTTIGLHNLRGLDGPIELFRCNPGFHEFLAEHGIY